MHGERIWMLRSGSEGNDLCSYVDEVIAKGGGLEYAR